jgi:hypothetical protein
MLLYPGALKSIRETLVNYFKTIIGFRVMNSLSNDTI